MWFRQHGVDAGKLVPRQLWRRAACEECALPCGFSEEATCYVSPECFADDDPYADFIVHEATHIFHNRKRATVGLCETRKKEWLLDIEYLKRETFAYACEAYARVFARGSPAEQLALVDAYDRGVRISDERMDVAEVVSIVRATAAARNGWKVILARCAPTRRQAANYGAK